MGVGAEKIGRGLLRTANGVVNLIIWLLILLLIAFSAYALWDSQQLYYAADTTCYERYKPRIEDQGKTFGELQALNPEVFSWLTLYGTNIDYPVVQGDDNMKYVNTNAEGEYSLTGAIFLDHRNRRDFSDFNSIFYGHHMEKNAMFGDLDRFAELAFFTSHRYGNLYVDGKDYGLEILMFLHADAYDMSIFAPAQQGEAAQQQYIGLLYQLARHTQGLEMTLADRIVLLTTCSSASTNGRDIVVARITDEPFKDTFYRDDDVVSREQEGIDKPTDWWENLPPWALPAGISCLVILMVFVLARKVKRKRQ